MFVNIDSYDRAQTHAFIDSVKSNQWDYDSAKKIKTVLDIKLNNI